MKYTARLVYKSVNTCFQTTLPVYFYGMPSGKMVVLFASCKNDFPDETALKWTLAEHMDFWYDFETGTILTTGSRVIEIDEFMELADNLEQRIITKATYGNFSNKTEAMHFLNVTLHNLLNSYKQKQVEMDYF
jgi:hypothetical protein